jgi:AbrB family looped-hinge helix DNA binding protein
MKSRKVIGMKSSRLVTLPADVCDALGIEAGDRLDYRVENQEIILTPAKPLKAQAGAATTD